MLEESIELFAYKDDDFACNSFYGMSQGLNQDFNDTLGNLFSFQKSPSEEEDKCENCDIQYFQQGYTQSQNPNKPIENIISIDNRKTKVTTKTNLVTKKQEEKKEIIIPNLIQGEKKAKSQDLLKKKKGRKNKEDNLKSDDDTAHTKKKEDNIMRKIKTHLIEFIVKLLNDSLKDRTKKFYKIDKSISENLKRDFNLALLQRTLEDIFLNTDINGRYKNYSNEALIKKIKKENIEEKTIELLSLKFIEVIYKIQDEYLEEYLESIKNKEIKEINIENSSVNEYMESLKKIFFGYEAWFKNKKGRNRESVPKN
jgi:hypothetical protein